MVNAYKRLFHGLHHAFHRRESGMATKHHQQVNNQHWQQ